MARSGNRFKKIAFSNCLENFRSPLGNFYNFLKGEKNSFVMMLITILVFVVILESTLQITFYTQNGFFLFNNPFRVTYLDIVNDARQYELRKNFKSEMYKINRLGFRGEIVEGNPDVLVLGDSVPFGINVKNDQTYSHFLSSEHKLKVINGGVPSYTLWQSLFRWKKDFNQIKPSIVTIQASNDCSLLTRYQDEWNLQKTWLEKRWQKGINLANNVFESEAIYHYVTSFIKAKKRGKQNSLQKKREGEVVLDEALKERFFEGIDKTLNEFVAYSLEQNVSLVFISVNPFYYMRDIEKSRKLPFKQKNFDKYYSLWNDLFEKLNLQMKQKAQEHDNVYYFDVAEEMDKVDRNGLYRDFLHHSPDGNRLFAELLWNFFKKEQLL